MEVKRSKVSGVIFLLLFTTFGCASHISRDGHIRISKFKISEPASGTYTPWNPRNRIGIYAGEVIIIQGSAFRYTRFSDTSSYIPPNYLGEFTVFADHIYLNDPRVPSPFRIAGIADGVPALLTREAYQEWMKTGAVMVGDILYFQKKE
jgi:hypothetical protein